MSKYLYRITRTIGILLVLYNLIERGVHFDSTRNILFQASLIIFLVVSFVYEKKTVLFTPAYLVYFIVIFIVHNVSPYTYLDNEMMLNTVLRASGARIPNDHYYLYFQVYFMVSMAILFYLLVKKTIPSKKIILEIAPNLHEARELLIITVLLLPIQLLIGSTFRRLLVPSVTYFFLSYYMFKPTRVKTVYIIGMLFSSFILLSQITWRFILLQYVSPILIGGIIFKSYTTLSRKLKVREKIWVPIVLLGTMCYGVISEMYKLGKINGILDIGKVFFNFSLLSVWIERQTYRIFDIWTVLGGNIIDYTNDKGFFFGLSYIKFLSPIFGFEYISLPKISADMVGANYAQPGLVAEGYANFGYIGSVINVLGVLLLLEFLWENFIKKQSMRNFLLVVVPFTSVLFDGGSLNSMIFSLLTVHILFLFRYIRLLIKRGKI